MSDEDLKERLLQLDESDENLNNWECDFMESVGFNWDGPYTSSQKAKIIEMLEKYGY